MKNLIKNSLVLVALFTTMLSNANETFVLRNLNDNKTTMLTLLNVEQGNQLLIRDADGIVLYKEKIQDSGTFTKGFNLTTLPNGRYYFELKNDLVIKKISFNVNMKLVQYKEENVSTTKKIKERSTSNQSVTNKTVELEKGVERRILSYKGSDFIKNFRN